MDRDDLHSKVSDTYCQSAPNFPNEISYQGNDAHEDCDSSCSCSCSSDSVSDWENEIDEFGEVFYTRIFQNSRLFNSDNKMTSNVAPSKRGGKLPKIITRRKKKNKKFSRIKNADNNVSDETANCDVQGDSTSLFTDTPEELEILYISTEISDKCYYYYSRPRDANLLYPLRGALATINHLMPRITTDHPAATNAIIRKKLWNIGFVTRDSKLLLVGIPDGKCRMDDVLQFKENLVSYLRFRYSSVENFFFRDVTELDRFFDQQFRRFAKTYPFSPFPFSNMPVVPSVNSLPDNIRACIDETMNEYQSHDFDTIDDENDGYEMSYCVVGTCLYHSGFLIHSHLTDEDQADVHLFVRYSGIMDEGISYESLVIWQRVYPTSIIRSSEKKSFLLSVGEGKTIFVALLESDASSLGPFEYYVDEMKEALFKLVDDGVCFQIDKLLGIPKSNESKNFSYSHLGDSRIEITSHYKSSASLTSTASGSFDGESRTSLASDESTPVVGRRAQRLVANVRSQGADFYNLDNARNFEMRNVSEKQKSASPSYGTPLRNYPDVLFDFVELNSHFGIVASLSTSWNNCRENSILRNVADNFKSFAESMRLNFLQSRKRANDETGMKNRSEEELKEQGAMFEVVIDAKRKKKSRKLTYWIIGRCTDETDSRELYVCHEGSLPLDMVEWTFRIAASAC